MNLSTLVNCKSIVKLTARYVLGHDAMKKMSNSNILILGLGGLGVEIGICES